MAVGVSTQKGEIVHHLDAFEVKLHPLNMRASRPPTEKDRRELSELAQSIKARGVLQPTVGVEIDGETYIVMGNRRTLAVRSLGDERPPLPVILRPQSELDQLLSMVAENLVRSRPDPISEARHYKWLVDKEGLSITKISRRTGVSFDTIKGRLRMLKLEEPVQQLIMEGKIHRGKDVINALLTLPPDVQIKAAEGFAQKRARPQVIKAVCTRLRRQAERNRKAREAEAAGGTYSPALEAAGDNGAGEEHWDGLLSYEEIQEAFSRACEGCTARPPAWLLVESSVERGEPPLWAEVESVSESMCGLCGLRQVESMCGQCPIIEFVRRLQMAAHKRMRDVAAT